MDARSPVPLGVAFCAGCAVSALIFALLGSSAPSGAASELASSEPIVAELRRLRESVERLDRAEASVLGGAAAIEPRASSGGTGRTPDLTPVLQQLQRTLETVGAQLADAGGAAGVSGIPRARESKRLSDWSLLQPIAEAMERDEQQAKRMVRFLTVPELLERFGPPDQVWAAGDSSSVRWNYERQGYWDGEETIVSEVGFRIQDGYVIDAWGSDNAVSAELEALEND